MAFLRLEKVKWSHFFLQKRHFKYKLSVIKQKTGQKTGKNSPKKVYFSSPPTSWLSLDRFWPGQNLFKQTVWTDFDRSKSVWTDFDRVKICPNWASWSWGMKNTPFLESFCPFFVLFFAFSLTICIWNAVFAKKNRSNWPSLAIGAPFTKFRHV